MSKFSKLGLRRAAGAGAVAAVAVVGIASLGAGNAAAVALPDGSKTTTGIDGTVVTIKRIGESAYAVPSLEANGAGRTARLSGNYTVTVPAGTSATLELGYVVGCQVSIAGLGAQLGGSVTVGTGASVSGGISLPIAPGQVAAVDDVTDVTVTGGTGNVEVQDLQIYLQKCAGYAQFRSYAKATVSGNYYVSSTLWGAPFSLT